MTVATAIEDGDLFILQRTISGVPVALSVPSDLLTNPSWTDSTGETQSTTLAEMAQKLAFFTISDGRLCINRDMLNATPTQDGELFDNGGLVGINHAS